MKFDMILACDDSNGIGKSGDLAWKIKADMLYFKNTTTNTLDSSKRNAVIMGYKTWVSIPEKFRPLSDRLNCIITRSLDGLEDNDNELFFLNFVDCIKELGEREDIESIFVIGGATLYNELLKHEDLDKIYLTKVVGDFSCDVFFDGIPGSFVEESCGDLQEEDGIKFKFCVYKNTK